MADADEDALLRASAAGHDQHNEDDAEDEAQDFRLLASLAGGSKASQGALLKRGTKDFEPNPTQHQANVLDESRQAMQDALSFVRSQSAKTHNVGQLVEDLSEGKKCDLRLRKGLVGRDWDDRCVVVYNFKSTFGRTFGRADFRSWTWLLPEEALFLLERGTLDIRWPDLPNDDDEDPSDDEDDDDVSVETEIDVDSEKKPKHTYTPLDELPISLQGAYATFLGRSGLNMDRWLVYSNLRRLGYIVHRAPGWYAAEDAHTNSHISDSSPIPLPSRFPQPLSRTPGLISRLLNFISNPRLGPSCPSHGPLLSPGLHRSYNDIYRSLALIPSYKTPKPSTVSLLPPPPPTGTTISSPQPQQPTGAYTPTYHVYKPSNTAYKKSLPPPPDFHICVLDARATNVPTMSQIGSLLDSMPSDELPADRKVEAKIKHGKRNVILAVVDIGVVSYLRVGEAESGSYNVWEAKSPGEGKGQEGEVVEEGVQVVDEGVGVGGAEGPRGE
ncbi:putative tRNA-splicing endonuclease subunit tsp-5 [Cyphellophora attinorum]|uniref:Putative tRNA-splicing endonuclease subunit tsp-5 n=1 Tax=Cyphellophora attinorum TaxID=1664694 RepID=A0A0N1H6T4_9EURO|nr:putative tRNA-splicing endonuclease subunit tsp-5 [Phialophora attinorum]KPI38092.1 putative tRNA-splicing endonuclease subunit tsp-5 [Phialophora attinorum]